jgi:hypothetical protein
VVKTNAVADSSVLRQSNRALKLLYPVCVSFPSSAFPIRFRIIRLTPI